MHYMIFTLITGVGATAVMDLWGIVRHRLFHIPPANYALVGRWVGHMPHGHFRHEAILRAVPVPGERLLGWIIHYATGIAFAAVLTGVGGAAWMQRPTPGLAMAVGIGTVLAPFLLMQPGMGAGIAASRTPRPATARAQSLVTHAVYGIGLYVAGLVASVLIEI